MIMSKFRFFCFHRKYFSLFLLLTLNHSFYANIFEIDEAFTKTGNALIKVENGALLYVESESAILKRLHSWRGVKIRKIRK
jgi:hypothetical protein